MSQLPIHIFKQCYYFSFGIWVIVCMVNFPSLKVVQNHEKKVKNQTVAIPVLNGVLSEAYLFVNRHVYGPISNSNIYVNSKMWLDHFCLSSKIVIIPMTVLG